MSVDADPGAFFRRFYPQLYRFISAATAAPSADVEDIVQETLLHAWRDRARFRAEAASDTWILSIAKHRIYDLRRHQGRGRAAEEVLRALARMDAEPIPEEIVKSVEVGRRVRRALHELPVEQGDLLARRYFLGESVREIAGRLGDGEKAVASRLQRAREAFREKLRQGGDDDEL